MSSVRPLKIGITCYPTVGGSGILATSLGRELALRGHEVHFISYEKPFRIPINEGRVFFHPVTVNDYELFRYPDYTLPLSVKMAEVARAHRLDVLHVHYAVPHATAALLARDMLAPEERPKIVATLHGTDTTLLGQDPGYGPAIRHALEAVDAVTAVSEFLRQETVRVLQTCRSIEVIHNFFEPQPTTRSRRAVRDELEVADAEKLIVHASNLRSGKRIDLLLETVARLDPDLRCRLLVLAGGDFSRHAELAEQLGIGSRVVVRENVLDVEDYVQAADVGLFTSSSESFCLSLLECMSVGCPGVSTAVGGIPEVVTSGRDGLLVPFGDVDALVGATEKILRDPGLRDRLGRAARETARSRFSAAEIVPRYLDLYLRLVESGAK